MQDRESGWTYKEFLQVLKECSPYDFSEYSDNSINRRIQKVMQDHNLTMEELIYRIRTNPQFVELVVEAITVNTTELFRDPEIWQYILHKLLPHFSSYKKINIWHAGCSTGQEVYSLMVLLDHLNLLDKADIYATDISRNAIENAKKGVFRYSFNYINYNRNFKTVFGENNAPDFRKYFICSEGKDTISVIPEFLNKVKYIRHDLVSTKLPFYNRFDLIFCRNVIIYFNPTLQSKIIQMFHEQLFPGSALILGSHETIGGFMNTKFTKNGPVYTRTNAFHFKY